MTGLLIWLLCMGCMTFGFTLGRAWEINQQAGRTIRGIRR